MMRGCSADADGTSAERRVINPELLNDARGRSWGFGRGKPSDARRSNVPLTNGGGAGVRFGRTDHGNPTYFSSACSYDNDPNCDFQDSAQRFSQFNTDARQFRRNPADTRIQDNYTTREILTSYQNPSPRTRQVIRLDQQLTITIHRLKIKDTP